MGVHDDSFDVAVYEAVHLVIQVAVRVSDAQVRAHDFIHQDVHCFVDVFYFLCHAHRGCVWLLNMVLSCSIDRLIAGSICSCARCLRMVVLARAIASWMDSPSRRMIDTDIVLWVWGYRFVTDAS